VYNIGRDGGILSIALDGQVNLVNSAAGCGGGLIVVSAGELRTDGKSYLVNNLGGILGCGVSAGNVAIVVAVTVEVKATTNETSFVPAPTTSPAPTPAPGDPCFSSHSTVQVQGRPHPTRMDELHIGDQVLVGDGSYQPIYSFGHKAPNVFTDYLQIFFAGNAMKNPKKPLEISPRHMLYVYNKEDGKRMAIPAQDLTIGDWLVRGETGAAVEVMSIHKRTRRGAYTPMTATGDIVVNGVVTSVYVELEEFQPYLSSAMQLWLQHAAFAPYRLYCGLFVDDCSKETYDTTTGYSTVVMTLLSLIRWLNQCNNSNSLVLPVFLGLVALPAAWIVLNMTSVIAILLGYYSWKKRTSGGGKSAPEK
jgi:hypothetical protein